MVQEKATINQEVFNTVARKGMRLGHVRIMPLPFAEFPSGGSGGRIVLTETDFVSLGSTATIFGCVSVLM